MFTRLSGHPSVLVFVVFCPYFLFIFVPEDFHTYALDPGYCIGVFSQVSLKPGFCVRTGSLVLKQWFYSSSMLPVCIPLPLPACPATGPLGVIVVVRCGV